MHHVSLDRIAFTISGILLAFAAVAGFGLRSGGDPFALRLMPHSLFGSSGPSSSAGIFRRR
jgi:hypothetical protein